MQTHFSQSKKKKENTDKPNQELSYWTQGKENYPLNWTDKIEYVLWY